MNFIKGTGLVVVGVGIGLLAARFHGSSGTSAPVQVPSAAPGPTSAIGSSPASFATDTSTSHARTAPRSVSAIHPSSEANLAQQQADARASLLKLDNRLRSEPVNPKWAPEQEATILAAISGDPNDGFPAKLPKDMDAQCRSSLCKVTMTFTDEEDAYQMQTKLTLGLRGPIATARTFYNQRPDGGTDLVIYAGAIAN
jgi:hypothetical protein